MAHAEKFKGKFESFYSRPLTELKNDKGELFKEKFLRYEGTFDAFGPAKPFRSYTDADWEAAHEELTAKGIVITKEDMVRAINNKLKANARSKQMQIVADLAGLVKPDMATDRELQVKTMMSVYLVLGNSEEDARAAAEVAVDAAIKLAAERKAAEADEEDSE